MDNGCTVKSRDNPAGDFRPSFVKNILLQTLYSKLEVPEPYNNVEDFLIDVQNKSQIMGEKAVLALDTTSDRSVTSRTG